MSTTRLAAFLFFLLALACSCILSRAVEEITATERKTAIQYLSQISDKKNRQRRRRTRSTATEGFPSPINKKRLTSKSTRNAGANFTFSLAKNDDAQQPVAPQTKTGRRRRRRNLRNALRKKGQVQKKNKTPKRKGNASQKRNKKTTQNKGNASQNRNSKPTQNKGNAWQPAVTRVEKGPATRVIGSISMPYGSRWCKGKQTVWFVGHQPNDQPWCLDGKGHTWKNDGPAVFDYTDAKNNDARRTKIDRHDCVHGDFDHNGRQDIVCLVGADRGKGRGWTELYLTQDDGSLLKIRDHGLQVSYTDSRPPTKQLQAILVTKRFTHPNCCFKFSRSTRKCQRDCPSP